MSVKLAENLNTSVREEDKTLPCVFEFSDEDYESAVQALNGKLYLDPPVKKAAACGDGMYVISCHTHYFIQLLVLTFVICQVPCWFD